MKEIPIQTTWAKRVSPREVLNEYPRPQLVRNNWENLNGLWFYNIQDTATSTPAIYTEKILVPYPIESTLSGVKKELLPHQALWYKRIFHTRRLNSGERVLLHFGAVDWKAIVFVNGKKVGLHEGGYTSFSFDITEHVNWGDNSLEIKVYDPTDKGFSPHGKQSLNPSNIFYTATSGIWQTVWLEIVPSTYINDLAVVSDFDNSLLTLSLSIQGAKDKIEAEISIFDHEELLTKAICHPDSILKLKIKNLKPWSPDVPFLYDLSIKLTRNGKKIDEIKSYFGIRKISIQKDSNGIDRIFLNNKYIYNLGVLDQGFWPDGLYTPPSDEALKFDIDVIKAMGFNTIRKHIKVEPARWYYYADKLGILVWQDFVNPNQLLPEGSKIAFEKQIEETMAQLKNSPCITTWVIFNEKWGQYDQQRITEWVKKKDPTRLVNGHSGELLYVNDKLRSPSSNAYISSDIIDVHSYPFPRKVPIQPNKVSVLGEFGGIGTPIEGHLWDDLVSGWGYNGVVPPIILQSQYSKIIDSLKILEQQGLSASIYTQSFDVESELNGLLTYDRSIIKLPIDSIRMLNSILCPTTKNYNISIKASPKIADNSNNLSYSEKILLYQKGKKDSAFLRHLAILAYNRMDTTSCSEIVNDYIYLLKNKFSIINIRLICYLTKTSKDIGFNLLYDNINKINDTSIKNEIENLIMNIVYKEEIEPYDKEESPDWSLIEKRAIAKYGHLGEERVWGNRMVYYYTKKDWPNFGKYYKLYFDRSIPKKRSFININNLSWIVFEKINDPSILETAIKATKYDVETTSGANSSSIDTHANLLYKSGFKDEAIKWEKKAVNISPNKKLYVETLSKMEKGLPTWN